MPDEISSIEDLQPLFSRYQAAWLAYQALQPEHPAEAIPYMRAASISDDSALIAAAVELRLAHEAWLANQTG